MGRYQAFAEALSTRWERRTIGTVPEGFSAFPNPPAGIPVIELGHSILTSDKARALLRRLRDLNWSSGPVALTRDTSARVQGCSSLDSPVEQGVRYRALNSSGTTALLEIRWTGAALEILAFEINPKLPVRRLSVPMVCDRKGRICARQLGARVSPESTDTRELERFLRRVLRSLWRDEAKSATL
jgi:hypothetical protein